MSDENSSHMIKIKARVTDYLPNAMTDQFDDGTFATYDATLLEVLSPSQLLGNRLTIYHTQPPDSDSIWRAIGSHLQFSLSNELFETNAVLFEGVVQGLSRVTT